MHTGQPRSCPVWCVLPCLGLAPRSRGASLGPTVPLLAQEVFELVHQLLRVKVVLTPWARCLITCRVIVLLQLPPIGLHGGVLRHRLVTLATKGLHGCIEGGHIQLQVEQTVGRDQECPAHRRIRPPYK